MSITGEGKKQNAGRICNVQNKSINNTYNTYTSNVLTLGGAHRNWQLFRDEETWNMKIYMAREISYDSIPRL